MNDDERVERAETVEHADNVEHADIVGERRDMPQPSAPETVAEVQPPQKHEPPVEPAAPVAPTRAQDARLPGWPKPFFHPVHGRREFADPTEHEQAGPDWRFPTAGEADAARTGPEADLVVFQNLRRRAAAHDEAGQGIVRHSVQAQEAYDDGYPEPLT